FCGKACSRARNPSRLLSAVQLVQLPICSAFGGFDGQRTSCCLPDALRSRADSIGCVRYASAVERGTTVAQSRDGESETLVLRAWFNKLRSKSLDNDEGDIRTNRLSVPRLCCIAR